MKSSNGPCALCHRHCALTFHHLIPRKLHRRTFFQKNASKEERQAGIYICRPCHSGLHKLYDEVQLGKNLNTLDALQADEAIARHVAWVAKQKIQPS